MSRPAFRAHERAKVDAAVSATFIALRSSEAATEAFSSLLHRCRQSNLLARRGVGGVAALERLAAFSGSFRRSPATWQPVGRSEFCVLDSLTRHVFDGYAIPKFLSSVWFEDHPDADSLRRGVVLHRQGVPFRRVAGVPMTRREEHLFLASPDHWGVPEALRRAELAALGASEELTDAVLATRLGRDLCHWQFWHGVMHFLTRHQERLLSEQVGPIVDYLHAVQHGDDGVESPLAEWSMKGRSLRSLMRQVEKWHGALSTGQSGLRWSRSENHPLRQSVEQKDAHGKKYLVTWEIVELTSARELRAEGTALRHCVASYARWCVAGHSRIWSLRRRSGLEGPRPILTIEVNPKHRTVVQVRGYRNERPAAWSLKLVVGWATREGLSVDSRIEAAA
jgi:hypothetical protein